MVSENQVREFTNRAIALGARVERFTNFDGARKFLSDFCREKGIKKVIVSKILESRLGNGGQIPILKFQNPAEAEPAEAGIIAADYGIAETGTLVQFSEIDREKLAGILPRICLAVLAAEKIAPDPQALADLITSRLAQGQQAAFISGPSRTADIECQLQIGVHGPAELVILLIDQESV